MNSLDRALLAIAPTWALNRLRARAAAEMMTRTFEAAQGGRRTENWRRSRADANSANAPAIAMLRAHARDLVRNNPYAKRAKTIIGNNGVGWGIYGKPVGVGTRNLKRARDRFMPWAESVECDFDGMRNLYAIQRHALRTIGQDGEILVRRRRRPKSAGLAIPMQLQVLEADFLDQSRDGQAVAGGGRIILGVEFDVNGRRVAYWLFEEHPGASYLRSGRGMSGYSVRVPAEDILHGYLVDRPGQVRGITWYSSVITRLKDHDEYEDATLMRQKIAACFAVAVTDPNGSATLGATKNSQTPLIETIEPGMVLNLPPGKSVETMDPPGLTDASYNKNVLQGIAVGIPVPYEDLTGNYGDMSFSSGRMSRLAHWASVHEWQYDIVIPQLCSPIFSWAMDALAQAETLDEKPGSVWTPPPMAMIEPDKEGLALMRLVRTGAMTPDEMLRERGHDPDQFWQEYADGFKKIDALGIVLDIDARKRTQVGNDVTAGAMSGDVTPP